MSKLKLTKWYSGYQKPVRKGVYQRQYEYGIYYCYWDGFAFGGSCSSAKDAAALFKHWGKSLVQNLPWRGVAK